MAFKFIAASLRSDYVFAHVTDSALLPFSGAGDMVGPHVVMLKKYDTPRVATSSDLSADALRTWVEEHAQPRVAHLRSNDPKHKAALKHIHEAKVPRVFVFGAFDGAAAMDVQLLADMTAAAAAHPELKFVVGDAELNPDTVSHFGLTANDLPAAVVHDVTFGQKMYTLPHVTPGGLETFISDFQAEKLVPIFKTAPEPEDDGAVTVLVATNFEAIVGLPAAAGKTILIKLYAPWCGFCKQLAPVYEEVGEHFAGRDDVIIAKMDADANSMTDARYIVTGVPTLFLQTSSGEAVPYTGEHTKEALIAFVEEHAETKREDALMADAATVAAQQAEL
jgi:protein disulfide isomerase